MDNKENFGGDIKDNQVIEQPNEEVKDNYNSFNEADMRRPNIRQCSPRAFTPRRRFNQYNSLMRSSAPFNYYSNPNGTNGYVVCYNGGFLKKFHPLVTRTDLSKYLKARSLYGERQKAIFQKPENYFLPRPNCVPNPVVDRLYNKSHDNFYPRKKGRYYERQPMIPQTTCQRFTNSLKRTSGENPNLINYKMTNNESCNSPRYMQPNNLDYNYDINYNGDGRIENNCPPRIQPQKNPELTGQLAKEEKKEKESEKIAQKNSFIFKPRTYRRFHKVQIFNNYKPFLVDGFKEYMDYC